jgi:hypothetical protein
MVLPFGVDICKRGPIMLVKEDDGEDNGKIRFNDYVNIMKKEIYRMQLHLGNLEKLQVIHLMGKKRKHRDGTLNPMTGEL